MRYAIIALAACLFPSMAFAADPAIEAKAEAAIETMFANADGVWKKRVAQDPTQAECSRVRNSPSPERASAIMAREVKSIVYPAQGSVLGDWKRGEALAELGTGGQFTDDASKPNGGNCYACHQIARGELSYGTLGPSLTGYGKLKDFTPAEAKAVYEKIYNSQATHACSIMPRFGTNGFLTIDQIRDLTAYLMSPDSPVNK